MYKILEIGDKEYKIEFTVEASLYKDCVEQVTELMLNTMSASDNADIKDLLSAIIDIPQTTLTMFYAGLMEHHGECGDKTILSKADARNLIKEYFRGHTEDESGNFYGFMQILIEQMGEDGFFKQIGLVQLGEKAKEIAEKKPKTPQDHKKKGKVLEKQS
jgi:hypothetical protein